MNYQYIEQLLDRYFDCLTTLEEEQILRSFFSQEDVPAHLMQYRDIFAFQTEAKAEVLGDDFDVRMLSIIEKEENAKKTTRLYALRRHATPLFRAAAIVAVVISVGNIAEHSISAPVEESDMSSVAVSPYIKGVDIESAIQIKDESRAEAVQQNDSLPAVKSESD